MSNLKDIQQIQSLIAKGKGMGYLTFDEVNKALPVEMNTPEQFEEIIGIFEQLEIAIVDSEKDGKKISATPTETDDDAMDGSLHLTKRAGEKMKVGALMFSDELGVLGKTSLVDKLREKIG